MLRYLPVLLIILLIVALIYPRTLRHDPATWHVDPLTAAKPTTPNSYRVGPAGTEGADAEAPVFAQDAATVGDAFAAIASRSANLVGGSTEEGWVTYVETSTLFGFPDYVSVRFIDLDEGGSTIAIFSRARLGQSDFGANKKRVSAWLADLETALT